VASQSRRRPAGSDQGEMCLGTPHRPDYASPLDVNVRGQVRRRSGRRASARPAQLPAPAPPAAAPPSPPFPWSRRVGRSADERPGARRPAPRRRSRRRSRSRTDQGHRAATRPAVTATTHTARLYAIVNCSGRRHRPVIRSTSPRQPVERRAASGGRIRGCLIHLVQALSQPTAAATALTGAAPGSQPADILVTAARHRRAEILGGWSRS